MDVLSFCLRYVYFIGHRNPGIALCVGLYYFPVQKPHSRTRIVASIDGYISGNPTLYTAFDSLRVTLKVLRKHTELFCYSYYFHANLLAR
jgi:hypothetical protein